MTTNTLTPDLLRRMDAYWRAANYLSVGQIYLYDNPLLKRPLTLADVKHMLLGHWGTTPGQNFVYAHLNRVIKKYDLDMKQGRLKPELAELAPKGERRMGANPHANGGVLLRDLRMPDYRDYAVDVPAPGVGGIGDTHVLGRFLRDVTTLNGEQRNFRVFGPDETLSNGLEALFEVTKRQWDAAMLPNDEFLAPAGRVMEMLSEHQCEGWLEGYLLTGRHGLFNCYEAFIHIVDSMFNQHAKWLKVTSRLPWRRKIASLNYLLPSHVWREDHNGFTHQDPGFIDDVVNKKAEVVRVHLPPDANLPEIRNWTWNASSGPRSAGSHGR